MAAGNNLRRRLAFHPWMLGVAVLTFGVAALLSGAWLGRLAAPWAWVAGLTAGSLLSPEKAREAAVDWAAVESAAEKGPLVDQGSGTERDEARPGAARRVGQGTPRAQSRPGAHGGQRRIRTSASPPALLIKAETILRLSKVATPPASRFVKSRGRRPAGLQLAGVSALGIGVRDGDVLTSVAGAAVTSRAAVITTILQLRAREARAVSGEFWRGQQRWLITVEMPYLGHPPKRSPPTPKPSATPPPAAPPPQAPPKPN